MSKVIGHALSATLRRLYGCLSFGRQLGIPKNHQRVFASVESQTEFQSALRIIFESGILKSNSSQTMTW